MGHATDTAATGMIKLAKSSEFPLIGRRSTSQDYPDLDQDFVGTYDGVAGKFDCDAAECTVYARCGRRAGGRSPP